MKNVLITGVSGYLGKRLCRTLAEHPDVGTIAGIDIAPAPEGIPKFDFSRMDIRDAAIGELLSRLGIDTLFHLAFVVKPIRNLALMHDIDYNGTRNVLEKAAETGVKQVIAVSSTLAYGAHADNPHELLEDAPLRGNRNYPYGHNKAQVDMMMQDFARRHPGMNIAILRPCTVFGPTLDNYVSRMLFRPVTIGIRGTNAPVQLVHEDDFARSCVMAMEKSARGTYNIAGDGVLPTAEMAARIGTRIMPVPYGLLHPLLESLWRLHVPGIDVNGGYLEYVRYPFVASNEKAKREIGFYPKYSTEETLAVTVRARKQQP